MEYVIFDDNKWSNFLPFTYTRAISDMRVGILKLRQRLGLYFDFEPNKIVIRKDLENLYKQRHNDWIINDFSIGEYLFINSRLRITENIKTELTSLSINDKVLINDELVAFKCVIDKTVNLNSENIYDFVKDLNIVNISENINFWSYSWDFINNNGTQIKEDYELVFYEEDNFVEIDPGVTALNPYDIWIGEGAVLKHGVILDASNGPVIIDENAQIMHNSVILGPAYIGKNSLIKVAAKIYPNTSIGPECKIGGEVEDSIIQAYSNKQHDGFLGHSYIGEWVNIGADTNNSDLKNTYKPVKVWFYPEKTKINSKSMFIGSFIGDHTKIGINCSLNTGTVIGFGANIYGRDLISDFIPSFSWGEADNLVAYQLDKFLETTSNVKIRRREKLVTEEIHLINKIYKNLNIYEGY